jgi:hypothetical protein
MGRIRIWLLALAVAAPILPVLVAQEPDKVREAAHDEGLVRFVIAVCFTTGSHEQLKLNEQSARYIRSLSAASAIPVSELERLVDDGFAKAKTTKRISAEQCKNGRDITLKLLSERDAGLGGAEE